MADDRSQKPAQGVADKTEPPGQRSPRPGPGPRRSGDTATRMSLAAAAAKAAGEDDLADDPPGEGEEIIDDADIDAGGPDRLYFRIGEVAQLVGVDAHVLRYWESEFRMKPNRSSSGQRLYRKQDLSRFLRIKSLLHDEGYTIAGARKVLAGGPTPAAAGVDVARVKDALGRISALRRRIRAIRDTVEP